jgi:3-deoxy-D-arabino-heptulosonate 7-phosphate (DAHP) synthase
MPVQKREKRGEIKGRLRQNTKAAAGGVAAEEGEAVAEAAAEVEADIVEAMVTGAGGKSRAKMYYYAHATIESNVIPLHHAGSMSAGDTWPHLPASPCISPCGMNI